MKYLNQLLIDLIYIIQKVEKYLEEIKDEEELTPEIKFEQWVLSICQKYDKAGYYMDVNWILNLSSTD